MSEKLEIWGVNDPNISAQLALAVKLDLFAKEAGLDVVCRFAESGTTMPQDVLTAEQKPFAFTQTPITSILLHDKNMSTKLLAPLADIAGTQQVVIQRDKDINTPQDLEGKRIGMAKGAAVFIALTNMAKDCHVDLDQIYFINLLPTDQLSAFREKKLDAIACWEPWTSEAQQYGGLFFFSGTRSEIPKIEGNVNWLINQSCLIALDETIDRDPETLIAILKVLQKTTTMINQNFHESATLLAEFFQRSPEDMQAIMRKNTYSMTMDSLFRIGVLSFRDFLYENGRVSLKFSENQLYRTDLLREVDPTLVLLEKESKKDVGFFEKEGIYYKDHVSFEGDLSHLHFLMADDSVVVRNFLNRTLEILHAEALGEATTGQEAIDMFVKLRPNFITMDLSMPGLSGVDAIQQIRRMDPHVNIIVISGIDVQEVREEVFKLGVKIFIKKPFVPDKAASVIRTILEKSRAR
ncbi:MAG: response regulator [Candidatus Vecturithrix sp.]|jgi:NitT/TauT family transport system substrate-binding protein|nr:response regulator [Candidatus Vecturithrix sp.]